ncbi:MAG: hypothetical protein IPF94_05140 [Betaproteobacteria bacterium]|nr:hypothetical protein [Betaproteobacteria bacterium]
MLQAQPVIDDHPSSADRVPTLTEVVELDLPVQLPVRVDDSDGTVPLIEATTAEPPAMTPLDVVAPAETIDGLAAVAADPAPQAMADDFVLAGLEADDVLADSEVGAERDVAPVEVHAPASQPVVDVEAVVGQVLSALMPRIDMLLESRLREALAPALARAADGLIRDTRSHLAVAVRDLVQEAVDRALQRRSEL